ncbi:hypothetical protein WJX74_000675 [Apatococcus lobatus]|uniref:Repressor of RNA polymerase III transcription n=2 Tax=Apatococcus TaxID=904362 RepID=A0AAW1SDZ4_9CHLO
MKFIDIAPIARIHAFLDNVDVGDHWVHGDLEVYSCKLAGLDKKLSRSLDEDVRVSSSPLEYSKSPVGPLSEASSRKTLIYLILTLNHAYPDYDFSQLKADNFCKEPGLSSVEEAVDTHLLEISRVWENTPNAGDSSFLDSLWMAIDEAIVLKESDVYSYKSDLESDPFGENGSVWSFNFFFYNKKMKRILYFSCRATSKAAAAKQESSDAKYNSDADAEQDVSKYGMANEMDL